MGFCDLDLTGQTAFRADVFRRELQSLEFHRLGRRKRMRGFRGDIDMAGGAYARTATFGELLRIDIDVLACTLECSHLRRSNKAFRSV